MTAAVSYAPRRVRHEDGTCHFSLLKRMALSPAHYRVACETPIETTRAMRVGTVAHNIVLGPRLARPLIRFDGDTRTTKDWKAFVLEQPPGAEIVTAPEWADGEAIARAVMADPVARPLLEGQRFEVPLKWTDGGIECATDGVDVIGGLLGGYLADLKTTSSTEPDKWKRHAWNRHYMSQLAFYEAGAKANGFKTDRGLFIIGVEATAPFAVTVLKLSNQMVEQGRKCVALWLERLRACEESDFWPTYVQSIVDFDLPAWVPQADDDDGEEVVT